MDIQRSIEIYATPEKVWPFLTKPGNILEWYVPLTKFEYTSEHQSGVGTTFYFEEKVPGGPMQLDCVITEWVENEALAFKMVSGNMMRKYGERWTVEAIPSGSKFTFRAQGEYSSAFLRLISPIAQRTSINTIEKILPRLKSLVEG